VIATAVALRRHVPAAEILYIGTTTGPETSLVRTAGLPFVPVRSGRLRRFATWRNLTDPFLVFAGVGQSMRIVGAFRPDVAFAAGGFATVPPLMAARLLGVPIVVHQQDVAPGLANRMLAPFARLVTTAFPETAAALHVPAVRVVGNPVRGEMRTGDARRARERFGLPPDEPVVLITGGGTGALRLNQIAHEAARELVKGCAIVHLTGAGKAIPGWVHPRYRQYEFLADEMADALAVADVIVTRAGMSALSEVAALRKPAIVVPMPDSHQIANARAVERHGAGIVVSESDLTPNRLIHLVRELLGDRERAATLGASAGRMLPADAADVLAGLLVDVSDGRSRSGPPGRDRAPGRAPR
jgi:UDP-N-acetylglucosamine--N-acetylmuramyl-(pentapeptide) pyrophosphoryl-undecaprenol N-acetylglucosamine transferase